MDNVRLYPCNREFDKTIKYNGHWYHLRSVFDDVESDDRYDFNASVNETVVGRTEDFADYLCRVNGEVDKAMLEKFIDALSERGVAGSHVLTIRPTISVYADGKEVAKINAETNADDLQGQLARFIKQANGYLNEIGLGVMGYAVKNSIDGKSYNVNPQLAALGSIKLRDAGNEYSFPDADANIGGKMIPLDFKACLRKDGEPRAKCSVAGSSNKTMISNILSAMVNACVSNASDDTMAVSFMKNLCTYQAEFKSMLLFVTTSQEKQGYLAFDSFKIKPLLACLRVAKRGDHQLLSSKSAHSMGAVAYFSGGDEKEIPFDNFGFPMVISELMNNFCSIDDYQLFIDNSIIAKNIEGPVSFEKLDDDLIVCVELADGLRKLSVRQFFNGQIADKTV